MASVTYHVVVTFDRNEEGDLVPGEPFEVTSAESARRLAPSLARTHAGVVGFSRTGDPATGKFSDANVLVSIGDVDLNALSN